MSVRFTQYLLPDGRKRSVTIDRPAEIEALAAKAVEGGLRFECETLTTGQVSISAHDPESDEDVAIEISANGPSVLASVDRVIRNAAEWAGRKAHETASTDAAQPE